MGRPRGAADGDGALSGGGRERAGGGPGGSTNERELRPDETELVGEWLDTGSRIEGDAVAARIDWLVSDSLLELAADESGWSTLYRDLRDGRLWERTHPHSHLARGGPPRLSVIAPDAAARKYGVDLR